MKRWGLFVVLLYGATILALTLPVVYILAYPGVSVSDMKEWFNAFPQGAWPSKDSWMYWVGLVVLLIAQAALLEVPVEVAAQRPVSRRRVLYPIIAAAGMGGLLAFGFIISVSEAITQKPMDNLVWWVAFGILLLSWLAWGIVFYRISKQCEPRTMIEKQCRLLLKGSIVELLVAVPTHILARSRDYCCAGFDTALGISFGLAVMLFSFGPGVFFLYLDRWNKVKVKK